ncbi:polyadenylate-binding protein 1-like [Hemibagrus wyckioides]|uniref:polyadenylate-binding protein 1-like n=1 Tax=Hemibagrus wyckioides TaxID=337641 RepID=UPI00266BCBBA|nr:polyadenylate-binding protein 1-like [Hemibagrus wyckioides]
MAALYVRDLDPAVTEEMLAWRFSPAGQIHSIRLCRDRYTGSSLGCAYVNFWHRGDAERAIDMFHFELLLERPMQVMWSQWETTWRNQEVGKIILKNLDKSIDNLALYDTFSYCGRILSCKVVNNESGSNGCGYIQFETAEAAELVIERFNGKLLNGTQVTIEHFKTPEQREAEKKEKKEKKEKERDQANVERQTQLRKKTEQSLLQNLNLYVKNLDCSVDDERLYAAFSPFGTIKSAKVMMKNGRSTGFGFVCFESSKEAMIAIQEMNGRLLCGKPLYVGVAQRKEERQLQLQQKFQLHKTSQRQLQHQNLNLYVKNLDCSVDDERLYAAFSPFGTIKSAKVMMKNGRSRRFGFVCFESSEEAMIAIQEMNGRLLCGKPLYVGVAQRKEERQAYLARLHNIPALVHQQTRSTESPSVEQHPAVDRVPAVETIQSVDSVPAVETVQSVDSVPAVEELPSEDSAPVVETAQPVDTVPVLENSPSEESVPVLETPPAVVTTPAEVPAAQDVPETTPAEVPAAQDVPETTPADVPAAQDVPETTPADVPAAQDVPETTPAPSTSEASVDKVQPDTKDESTPEPTRNRLTIYMLESSPLEDQIQLAYDYMLPLVEEIHPVQARKITWLLVERENNFEIMNMIGDPDLLHVKVNEMDALLKAREAGYKPEVLKRTFNTKNNKNKKKRKNKNRNVTLIN